MMKFLILLFLIFISCEYTSTKRLKGLYVSGFEMSKFVPLNDSTEQWWLTGGNLYEIEEKLKLDSIVFDGYKKRYLLLDIQGKISSKIIPGTGGYGHFSKYDRKIDVIKVFSIKLDSLVLYKSN